MKPFPPLRSIFLAFLLTMARGIALGDEDEPQDGEDKAEVTVETVGKLAGHRVTLSVTRKHEELAAHNERFDADFAVEMEVVTKEGGRSDTASQGLLQWSSTSDGIGSEAPDAPDVKAKKNSLKLYNGGTLLADFELRKDRLEMAPDFRKKIITGLEKDSSGILSGSLLEILQGSAWPDKHVLQVLTLYGIRDSIRSGEVDAMVESLKSLASEAADDTIARYCKRLSDSLVTQGKKDQPLRLEGAKKIGTIMNDPVYPPLDSPTVFWRDTLLIVVQEEAAAPRLMRPFDPRQGKWGAKAPVKFPETAMSKLFEKNTGTYSVACPGATVCWRKKLGEFNDDPCDGLDCSPLILLDDSIDGGSLNHFSDLAKAGGSCAAGWGTFEFRNGGNLYRLGDYKQSWNIIPGSVLSGTRKYEFALTRDYPVAVSPDQNWIAYAVASKDGLRKELWVARLKYKK